MVDEPEGEEEGVVVEVGEDDVGVEEVVGEEVGEEVVGEEVVEVGKSEELKGLGLQKNTPGPFLSASLSLMAFLMLFNVKDHMVSRWEMKNTKREREGAKILLDSINLARIVGYTPLAPTETVARQHQLHSSPCLGLTLVLYAVTQYLPYQCFF